MSKELVTLSTSNDNDKTISSKQDLENCFDEVIRESKIYNSNPESDDGKKRKELILEIYGLMKETVCEITPFPTDQPEDKVRKTNLNSAMQLQLLSNMLGVGSKRARINEHDNNNNNNL